MMVKGTLRECNFSHVSERLTVLLNLTHVCAFDKRCKQTHLRSDVVHFVIHFHHPRADQLKEFQGLNGGNWHVLGLLGSGNKTLSGSLGPVANMHLGTPQSLGWPMCID